VPATRADVLRLTPEPVYADAWRRRLEATCPVLPTDAVDVRSRLLVVVAHPDDETLALGATLADLSASGIEVHVVSLTSGEAAVAHVGTRVDGLAQRRRDELTDAGATLGLADCTALDLPDGRLAEHPGDAALAVRAAAERCRPDRIATLWRDDPHPDHRATSAAVAATCGPVGVDEFLLWAMHWTDPDDVPGEVLPVACGPQSRRARRTALSRYRSQIEPLAAALGPVLPPAVVTWPFECVVRP
jgi:LmbE family N-acetylglucosaminyl deacetylase